MEYRLSKSDYMLYLRHPAWLWLKKNDPKKLPPVDENTQALFDSGKEVLLGTNKHPNKDDRMKHDLELFPFVKIKPRKTLISPIIEKRLAEKVEQERLSHE